MSDDVTIKALAASLDYRQIRQELNSANIANADTPGYRAKKIDFEEALARALNVDGAQNMNVSDKNHYVAGSGGFNNLSPEIYDDPNGIVSEDGNNVDREAELAQMAENKIMFDASVQLLNKKMGLMKYAIGSEQ